MNTKAIFSVLFTVAVSDLMLAIEGTDAGSTGFGEEPAPIDTYQMVLIVAAVLLTVGVIAYKKLSLKKADSESLR